MLAHLQLGEDLESGGDTVTAIAHYKSAVALAPSAEILNHVGVSSLASVNWIRPSTASAQRSGWIPGLQNQTKICDKHLRLKQHVDLGFLSWRL